MGYDFARLSPVMAKENFINNYTTKMLSLTKEQLNLQGDMLMQLLESGPVNSPANGSFANGSFANGGFDIRV